MKFTIEDIKKALEKAGFKEDLIMLVISLLPKSRTLNQNSAMYLYFTQLAKELNDQGQTINLASFFDKEFEVSFSMNVVKERIWKPIQLAKYDIDSTTELTSDKVTDIYDVVNNFSSTRFGIHIPFPNIKELNKKKNECK